MLKTFARPSDSYHALLSCHRCNCLRFSPDHLRHAERYNFETAVILVRRQKMCRLRSDQGTHSESCVGDVHPGTWDTSRATSSQGHAEQ